MFFSCRTIVSKNDGFNVPKQKIDQEISASPPAQTCSTDSLFGDFGTSASAMVESSVEFLRHFTDRFLKLNISWADG